MKFSTCVFRFRPFGVLGLSLSLSLSLSIYISILLFSLSLKLMSDERLQFIILVVSENYIIYGVKRLKTYKGNLIGLLEREKMRNSELGACGVHRSVGEMRIMRVQYIIEVYKELINI